MTSHAGRLYALALSLLVFFLAWAVIAAHPWATPKRDPRLAALAAREAQLRHEAALVKQVVSARWATYRAQLKLREAQIAKAKAAAATAVSAPVQVVNLPPLTITRTS